MHGHRRRHQLGLTSPRAPWRRAARPLAILFAVQLSGIGCAARPPEIAAPTRPDEFEPFLTVYEDQLEGAGMSLESAEEYLAGRRSTPLAAEGDNGGPSVPNPEVEVFQAARDTQFGTATFRFVDGVPEYVIGSGDLIHITTYLGPESATPVSYRVQADGTIFIGRFNIGSVQAAGSTPTELTRTLSDLYRQYVPTGYAEIRIEEYNAWSALLTGEIVDVNADGPGNYALDGRVTVADFIYSHGGPTEDAALQDVSILRQGAELSVDVAGVLAGRVEDLPLAHGDIVNVPSISQGDSVFIILGEVGVPGVYPFSEGISVLDAIAQAGGWTQTAKREAAYVSRPTTSEVIPVNLDVALGTGQAGTAPDLEAGDFVIVPFSPNRSQQIRDWVGIFSLMLSAITIIELLRRN